MIPALKADSEETMELGMAITSCATLAKMRYFISLIFHQSKISKLETRASQPCLKY